MNAMVRLTDAEKHAMQIGDNFANASVVHAYAPSLFATSAHPKMSAKYAFTNTYDILLHMHNKGFRVTSVLGGKSNYNKVLVRMRNTHHDVSNERANELAILDSHDGTSVIKMFLGILRFACLNGMLAGDAVFAKSYRHSAADLMAQIMLDLQDIDSAVIKLNEIVALMRVFNTTIADRLLLAQTALEARYGDDYNTDLRSSMLEPCRSEDRSNDLYTVMNVVQENVLRGGAHYVSNNRVNSVRPISAVTRNVKINQQLWLAAENIMNRPKVY